MKIAVLGSTKGTDLEGIIKSIKNGDLEDVSIEFVLSNKRGSYILERARKNDIKDIYLDPKGLTRIEYDQQITELLIKHGIDLILLIGYMKLMSSEFVKRWEGRVMNIHPSLLPAFAGGIDKNVHQQVLDRGCKITGASLIFIDEGPDTGPIISQKTVQVYSDDTITTLKSRVQEAEQELLIEAIDLFRDNKIKIENNFVIITG